MFRNLGFGPQIAFAPADDDAGAAAAEADTAAAAATAAEAAAAAEAGGAANWWEGDKFSDDQRTSLTALGLTVDDQAEATAKLIDMETSAKRRLGQSPEDLMTRPAKDGDVAEWLREHGDVFGIPKDAEGYEVKPPEDWPEGAKWDTDLEGKAREIALKHGHNSDSLQDYVNLFAAEVARLDNDGATELAVANTEMMSALEKGWGDQTSAKIALAQQGASVLGAAAGLDQDAITNIASVLQPKIGDANTIKLFAALAENMGEDMAAGLRDGNQNLTSTPAEARAELQKMRSPGGEYYEATNKGDRAEMKRLQPVIDRLTKIAAPK